MQPSQSQQTAGSQTAYPSFRELLDSLLEPPDVSNAPRPMSQEEGRGSFRFLPGDIVSIIPGLDFNGPPSTSKWWLMQVRKSHPLSKTGLGCKVAAFWLDTPDPLVRNKFELLPKPVDILYGTLPKDPEGSFVVILVEILQAGWDLGRTLYDIHPGFVDKFDELGNLHRAREAGEVSGDQLGLEEESASNDELDTGELREEREKQRELEARERAQESLRASVREGAGARRSSRLGANTGRALGFTSFCDMVNGGASNRSNNRRRAHVTFGRGDLGADRVFQ
jgi:hypothetical protein